jgi:hypothetical protein
MSPVNSWYVVSVIAPENGRHGWTPCIKWCFEQYSRSSITSWGFVGEGVFEFREEKHAAWFMLRWQ